MRSAAQTHDMPLATENATASIMTRSMVPPVNPRLPSSACETTSPTMPPGQYGSDTSMECRRIASKPLLATSITPKPANA